MTSAKDKLVIMCNIFLRVKFGGQQQYLLNKYGLFNQPKLQDSETENVPAKRDFETLHKPPRFRDRSKIFQHHSPPLL